MRSLARLCIAIGVLALALAGAVTGAGKSATKTSDVVTLNEKSFKQMVMTSNETWLVEFFAPWCVRTTRSIGANDRLVCHVAGQD